jgi:Holliday junction resolvasome RuvABC DNA-binding subunit
MPDEQPDTSYLEQEGFEDRLEEFENGEFSFVGIKAVAHISVNGLPQSIESMGVWGVESDSDDKHFDEMADEELSQLVGILEELGFSRREVDNATRDVDWEEE